eukprot:6717501-Ditylum_brightwellii.AAC.1
MIGHNHYKKEGNDGSMWCAPRANRPLILCDDNMFGCYHYKKEGDDGSMWHTHIASQPPVHDKTTYTTSRKKGEKKDGTKFW